METRKMKLALSAGAIALSMALAGCGGGGSSGVAQGPAPDPEPTSGEKAADAAGTAATDAGTAATAASTDAGAAMTATMDLATIQTNAMAASHAEMAKKYANMAATEQGKADTASAAAKTAAGTGDDAEAGRQQAMAEAAQKAAEGHAAMAKKYADMAVQAAAMEIKISGTMKSVGASSVDASAPKTDVTEDGETTTTGLLEPLTMTVTGGGSVTGADKDTETNIPYTAPVAAAESEVLAIGKVLDTSDDMARLVLVTQQADTKTVNVFSRGETELTAISATKKGYVSVDLIATGDLTETDNIRLRSEGTFYKVSGGTAGTLSEVTDMVEAGTDPETVYSYVNPNDNARVYVVLHEERKNNNTGDTTYIYRSADIFVSDYDRDDDPTTPDDEKVTANLPTTKDYAYLHFGTWASLGEAEKDGTQELSSLGIGFVNAIDDSMTPVDDMRIAGSATYNGSWVANVQDAHPDGEGAITQRSGIMAMTANFAGGTVGVDMHSLAKISGAKIEENGFTGGKVSMTDQGTSFVTEANASSFIGSVNGGFFGPKAEEAGGVFQYTSKQNGAFTGAFGGATK